MLNVEDYVYLCLFHVYLEWWYRCCRYWLFIDGFCWGFIFQRYFFLKNTKPMLPKMTSFLALHHVKRVLTTMWRNIKHYWRVTVPNIHIDSRFSVVSTFAAKSHGWYVLGFLGDWNEYIHQSLSYIVLQASSQFPGQGLLGDSLCFTISGSQVFSETLKGGIPHMFNQSELTWSLCQKRQVLNMVCWGISWYYHGIFMVFPIFSHISSNQFQYVPIKSKKNGPPQEVWPISVCVASMVFPTLGWACPTPRLGSSVGKGPPGLLRGPIASAGVATMPPYRDVGVHMSLGWSTVDFFALEDLLVNAKVVPKKWCDSSMILQNWRCKIM